MWWAQGSPGSNIAKIESDLRELGWREEAIAIERAEAKRLAEPGLIWPENWTAAQVFEACEWEVKVGHRKPWWQCIRVETIRAACVLMRVPHKEWPDVFDRVRLMQDAALPILNEDRG